MSMGSKFEVNRGDNEKVMSVSPGRKVNHALDSRAFTIIIDNAVIEPINMLFCVRAPSQRIPEDFKFWHAVKLLLNEDVQFIGL